MKTKRPINYFNNLENCKTEALKFSTRTKFNKGCYSAYETSLKNGWMDIVCSHMPIPNRLTKEKCRELALQCNSATEFKEKFPSAQGKIYSMGWNKELCSHFIKRGNKFNKCVYVYEFPNNYAYIGITFNLERRNNSHFNITKNKLDSSVAKHIVKTNLKPILKQLTGYIPINDAVLLEEKYLLKYKNDGWNILNVAKTGAIGGSEILWNKKTLKTEALKYNSRNLFKHKSSGAYSAALDLKCIDEICQHMLVFKKNRKYWTKDRCLLEAKIYKSRMDFKNNSYSAYDAAVKHKWLDEICEHMKIIRRPNGYWTKDRCREIASNYNNKSNFEKGNPSAHQISYKNHWLDEFFPKLNNI